MSSNHLTAVSSQPGASGGRTWDGQPGGATKGIHPWYRTGVRTSAKPRLDFRQVGVTQPGRVVPPPDVAVDQPAGHPLLVAVEDHRLERRSGRPLARRQEAE